jgi:polysaccharide export outer membrane protein
MRRVRGFIIVIAALSAAGCIRHAPPPPPEMAVVEPAGIMLPVTPPAPTYRLDSGDKLRVTVFGQEGLTNSYAVDANGSITLPLIGSVPARGQTTAALSQAIGAKLRQGFIREPHVAVEVETYRPFFILGEVTYPGQYPYVANMTVETAVAIAGGFTPRAFKYEVKVTRNVDGVLTRGPVALAFPVQPGDTINIAERWF